MNFSFTGTILMDRENDTEQTFRIKFSFSPACYDEPGIVPTAPALIEAVEVEIAGHEIDLHKDQQDEAEDACWSYLESLPEDECANCSAKSMCGGDC